jgi:hypothetical protein
MTKLKKWILGLGMLIISAIGGVLLGQKAEQTQPILEYNQLLGNGVAWYNSSWLYRMALTVDYTKIGTTTPLTNFPILISTTTPTLAFTGSGGHMGNNDGTDIVITNSDGTTKLNHEIESYTSTTGATILWVKDPNTLSTSTNTTLYLYYGNAGVGSQATTTGVWDSNYVGVWHLKESQTPLYYLDSTSYANNGTSTSTAIPTASSTGQIDGAQIFDGSNDYLGVGSDAELDNITSFTLEGWMNDHGVPSNGRIYQKGSTVDGGFIRLQEDSNNQGIQFSVYYATTILHRYTAINSYTHNTLTHIAATWDGTATATNAHLFVNGIETSYATTTDGVGTKGNDSTGIATFGRVSPSNITAPWDGMLDEMRISNSVRSASWIATAYNNQSSPSTFMTWATEENAPVTAPTTQWYINIDD